MLGFGKKKKPELQQNVELFLSESPSIPFAVAMSSYHLPHGGAKKFWYEPVEDLVQCYEVHYLLYGNFRTRHVQIGLEEFTSILSSHDFYSLLDVEVVVMDGMHFSVAISDRIRSHHFTARGMGVEESPHLSAFCALTNVFKERKRKGQANR